MKNRIKVGLPKSGLKKKSLLVIEKLLEKDVNEKQLSFSDKTNDLFLLKHKDIPRLVEDGWLDLGITSMEWIKENQSEVQILKELEWCDTRICLITGEEYIFECGGKVNCITEFPHLAEKYFCEKNIVANVYKVSGSSEACVNSMFDCCVDCVETGSTIKENHLAIRDVILDSKVVLIARKDMKCDIEEVKKIVDIVCSI